MEVGDKVAIQGDYDHWQAHLSWWILRFGIVISYPRVLFIESIDRFGLTRAGNHLVDIDNFRPYRWWLYLQWR